MHSYRKFGDDRWAVGFESPSTAERPVNFRTIREFDSEADAAMFASFLNGGEKWLPF